MYRVSEKQNNLVKLLNENRLNAYKISATDDYSILFERYLYNIKVSQAFYPLLAILEVTLRNRLHDAIETIYPNWLFSELKSQKILKDKEHKKLLEAKDKLERGRKKVTPSNLVTELSFGFWVHLCTKQYKLIFWDRKKFFTKVFSNYPKMQEIDKVNKIYPYLIEALKLRNRIFHHEIIITRGNIEQTYDKIRELLCFIGGDTVEFYEKVCNFKTILKQG